MPSASSRKFEAAKMFVWNRNYAGFLSHLGIEPSYSRIMRPAFTKIIDDQFASLLVSNVAMRMVRASSLSLTAPDVPNHWIGIEPRRDDRSTSPHR